MKSITEKEKVELIEMVEASCINCKKYRKCYPECELFIIINNIKTW